jgi:hypothetical protein
MPQRCIDIMRPAHIAVFEYSQSALKATHTKNADVAKHTKPMTRVMMRYEVELT